MGDRSLAEEWEAQADAWVRWTRTPGHDYHFLRYNWPWLAFVFSASLRRCQALHGSRPDRAGER